MKKRSLLKKGAGLVLAGSLVLGMQSTVFATNPTLTDSGQNGNTDVAGEVSTSSGVSPSYIITIPEKIDFGTLSAPETDQNDYKDISFDVTASSFVNFSDNTGVAVLVKDSQDVQNAGEWSGVFNITKDTYSLAYSILDPSASDVSDGTLTYTNGLLFHVFGAAAVATSADSSVTVSGTVRLNQRQLYGYDLDGTDADMVGTYDGTIDFYSTVVDLNSYLTDLNN